MNCLPTTLFAVLILVGMTARADEPTTPQIGEIKVGLDNAIKVGVVTPVTVTVESGPAFEGELSVIATDPRGSATRVRSKLKILECGSTTSRLELPIGRLDGSLIVEVQRDREVVDRRRLTCSEVAESDIQVVKQSRPFWLLVGHVPVRQHVVESAVKTESKSAVGRSRTASELLKDVHRTELPNAAQFPTEASSLASYDLVVVAGQFEMSPQSSKALNDWVKAGGHLIVSVGTRAAELASSPLADWVLGSGRMATATKLIDLGGIESFAATEFRIPIVTGVEGCVLQATDGATLVSSGIGDRSLVTRSAHGFGRITLLGLDLDKRPLEQWRGLDAFLVALSDLARSDVKSAEGSDRISRTGITELATQLNTAVADIPAAGERSMLGLLGLILVYLAVIGPLDYLLVHRLLKRPQLTWVTFPCAAVIAVLLATLSAGAASGTQLNVRQLDVIDVETMTGFVRHTNWSTLYSPDSRRFDVRVQPEQTVLMPATDVSATRVSWFASPETNFGGMYRTAGLEVGKPEYEFHPGLSGFVNLPVSVGSCRTWRAETTGTLADAVVTPRLHRTGIGQFRNDSELTHHLPVAIEDWMVAYGGRVFYHSVRDAGLEAPTSIAPGKPLLLNGPTVRSRELRGFMTGATYKRRASKLSSGGEEDVHQQEKYDVLSIEIPEVLRMLTFHESAGGPVYTGLTNSALRTFDLTDLVALDRAVLFGRIALPVTQVAIDGSTEQQGLRETMIRVVMPVADAEKKDRTLPKFKP